MDSQIKNANKEHRNSLTKAQKVALWITTHVGTIDFAIFCIIFVSIPLIWKESMATIFYISSGYLQLVMLPLIMVGQNLQSKHSEKRSEIDYELNVKSDKQIKNIIDRLYKQEEMLKEILNKLNK